MEDEAITRAGLKAAIDWKIGLTLLGEACDGKQALDIICQSKPDIVITDMKMPTMDGVQFLRELERIHPDCNKIVISAYTDFPYMHQAVVSGALDYLLKPVCAEDLNRLLRRIVEKQTAANAASRDSAKSASMSEEQILSALAGCFLPCENEILARLREPYLDIEGPSFVAQVVYLPDYEHEGFQRRIKGRPLYFSIWEKVEDLVLGKQEARFIRTIDAPSEMLIVWRVDSSCPDEILPRLRAANTALEQQLCELPVTSFSIGFGRVYSGRECIARSYRDACMIAKMMSNSSFTRAAANINAAATWLDLYCKIPSALEFVACMVGSGTEEEVRVNIDRLFSRVTKAVFSRKNIPAFSDTLVDVLRQVAADKQVGLEAALGDKWQEQLQVARGEGDAAAIRYWFESMIRAIVVRTRLLPTRAIIKDVEAYIRRYFYKDLILDAIARKYHVHPVHLSRMFKEEVGENFTDYLTRIRLERALHLLRNPDLTVKQVAEFVGYDNPYYFTKIFKRRIGVYPSEGRTPQHLHLEATMGGPHSK